MAETSLQRPERDASLDVAKGIAIIAIVLGHVVRGLAAADILSWAASVRTLDVWLYSWHLSVFALLSGLFVARSVRRSGRRPYIVGRLWLFGYLYLVWSVIQGGVKLAAPSGVNNPVSPLSVLQLWYPDGQLWFLPWIAVATTVVALAGPWMSRSRAVAAVGAAVLVSLAAWGLPGQVIGLQGWGLAAFYVAGVTIGAERFQRFTQRWRAPLAIVVGSLVLAAAVATISQFPVTTPNSYGTLRTPVSVALGVLVSVTCTLAIILVARALGRVPALEGVLALCGRRSLEIFLAHIVATAGTRTLLVLAGAVDPVVHVVAGTLVGVIAPLVLWRLGTAVRFPWLFAAPALPAKADNTTQGR